MPRNRLQLDLDPITQERLEAAAAAAKVSKERCAYELLQRCLGIEPPPPLSLTKDADDVRSIRLSDFAAFKPDSPTK